jgi:transposase
MDAHENTLRLQVLSVSDTGRRRRWTHDKKVWIVEESLGDGVKLAEVARRYDVSRSQLYDWRYRYRYGSQGSEPQFLRLLNVKEASAPESLDPDNVQASPPTVMTVDLGPRCRVTIPSGFDIKAAARLLNGLTVRS